PPSTWWQMLKHPHRQGFEAAANEQFNALLQKQVFRAAPRQEASNYIVLPYKARLCIRGDKEPVSAADNYAATLAIRAFRMLMGI
ncbi:hypothetical protein K402DRAFT_319388, partial [Aulographum hederae CBS 113979]